jgi:hypothetical protein
VIRSTRDLAVPGLAYPPANHPFVKLPVAPRLYLAALNGPLLLAVAVSVANVIRLILDCGPGFLPAPNQPAVACEGGANSIVNPPPLNVIPAVIVTGIIYLSLVYLSILYTKQLDFARFYYFSPIL